MNKFALTLLWCMLTTAVLHAQQPVITSLSSYTAHYGAQVTINGHRFDTIPDSNIVYFGAVRARQVIRCDSNFITVLVPAGSTYSRVSVMVDTLTGTSAGYFAPTFAGSDTIVAASIASGSSSSTVSANKTIEVSDLDMDDLPDVLFGSTGKSAVAYNSYTTGYPGTSFNTRDYAGSAGLTCSRAVDINCDGRKDLVYGTSGGLIGINRNLTGSDMNGNFSTSPYTISASGASSQIAIGDVNNDGKPDIIGVGSNLYLSVFINNCSPYSNIVFSSFTRTDIMIPTVSNAIELADIDGDGWLDIVLVNTTANTLTVLRNTFAGTVTFAAPAVIRTAADPRSITIADLDLDQKPDLLVPCGTSNTLAVFRNIAVAGLIDSFSFDPRVDIAVTGTPVHVSAGDFDGDGFPDLLTANQTGNTLALINNRYTAGTITAASFASPLYKATVNSPCYSAMADMNMDQKPDLLILGSSSGTNALQIFNNIGESFGISLRQNQVCASAALAVPFTATSNFLPGNKFILQLSDSSGSFASALHLDTITGNMTADTFSAIVPAIAGSAYRLRVMADAPLRYSSDNLSDISIRNCPLIDSITPSFAFPDSIIAIYGKQFSAVVSENKVWLGSAAAHILSASDSMLQVTVPRGANYKPATVTVNGAQSDASKMFKPVFLGGGNSFSEASMYPPVNIPVSGSGKTEVADFDKDGYTDFVYYTSNTIRFFRNIHSGSGPVSAGSFAAGVVLTPASAIRDLNLADMNNDGYTDVIVWAGTPHGAYIYLNTGSGISFSQPVIIYTNIDAEAGAVGDLDLDGRLDLVVVNGSQIWMMKNSATDGVLRWNSFEDRYSFTGQPYAYLHLDLIDLDGNRYPDILVRNNARLDMYDNLGQGFSVNMFNTAAKTFTSLVAGHSYFDMDYDGTTDLILSGSSFGDISVMYNYNTAPPFQRNLFSGVNNITSYSTNTSIRLALTELDGDRKADIIMAGVRSGKVELSIFRRDGNTSNIISDFARYTIGTGSITGEINTADFDNDGKIDILLANSAAAGVSIFQNRMLTFQLLDADTSVSYCTGGSFLWPYNAPEYFNTGNTFTAELSDSSGSFSSPVVIGSTKATYNHGNYSDGKPLYVNIPTNIPSGDHYRVRIVSSDPAITSSVIVGPLKIKQCMQLLSFTPLKAQSGAVITIKGSNLSGISRVHFGAAWGRILFVNDTIAEVEVPTGAVHGPVTVIADQLSYTTSQYFTPTFASTTTGISASRFTSRAEVASSLSGPFNVLPLDADDNGAPDLVITQATGGSVHTRKNITLPGAVFNATTSFDSISAYVTGGAPEQSVSADFDNDGKLDFAVLSKAGKKLHVFKNVTATGTPAFELVRSITTDSNAVSLTAGDIDADGLTDLAVLSSYVNQVAFYKNVTTDTPSFELRHRLDVYLNRIVLADLTGDGWPELIGTSNIPNYSINAYKNMRRYKVIDNASFSSVAYISVPLECNNIAAGDLNGDGKADLIATSETGSSGYIFINTTVNDSISVAARVNLSLSTSTPTVPGPISVGDLDGDGLNDVAVANGGGTSSFMISLFRNSSSGGTFSMAVKTDFTAQSSQTAVSICDYNRDGRNDLAFVNRNAGTVSIYGNNAALKEPDVAPLSMMITNVTDSGMLLTWTRGNGARCMVLAKQSTAVDAWPSDANEYAASDTFAMGSQLGTGNYVVYSGGNNSVFVRGLNPLTAYHFAVLEFNGRYTSANYFTTAYATASATTLPVNLVSFTAEKEHNNALLKWITASERNNKGFWIERSSNSDKWEQLVFVNGKGTTNNTSFYTFTDDVTAMEGYVYYRLRQQDHDGKEQLSPVRTLHLSETQQEARISPNPANESLLIDLPSRNNWKIVITDMQGIHLLSYDVQDAAQTQLSLEGIRQGIYILTLTGSDGMKQVMKFVKQ